MPISPSLFIGLGDFGSVLSDRNHDIYNRENPKLSKLHASISVGNELTFRSSNQERKIIGALPFKEDNSFKDNFKILNNDLIKLKELITEGVKYIYNKSNSLELIQLRDIEIYDKKKIIIYFSLGDNISSIIIQKTLEIIAKQPYDSIEIYLICINYDLLDEDPNRSYACLSELDHFLSNNLQDQPSVNSFTILSAIGPNDFSGHDKNDIIYHTSVLTKKIISNQTKNITSDSILNHTIEGESRIIYNTFGYASLVYDKDKVWQKFCDYERITYLTREISAIENIEIPRGEIAGRINRFIKNNREDKLRVKLSQDENYIPHLDDIKKIISSALSNSKTETALQFISILKRIDAEYDANNWEESTQKVAASRHRVEDEFKANLNENLLSVVNENDSNDNNFKLVGFVKLRALLNLMLGGDDKNIDGFIIDEEYNLLSLMNGQLNYFKDLYKAIPEEDREDGFKEIIYAKDLQQIRKESINKESRITDIKSEILDLDRSYLFLENEVVIEKEEEIKDGYFTIGGEQVNVQGCIEKEIDYKEKFIPDIKDLPDSVDLRRYMSPDIEHQGMIGSCVTNAITSAIEYISYRATGKFFPMSRMFLYYTARIHAEGDIEIKDTGCNIIQALKSAKEIGVCLEETCPYDIEKVNEKPDTYAFVEAEKYKIDQFLKVTPNLDHMLACLAEGYPFVFGLRIKDSFGKINGIISEPVEGESRTDNHANHAMLCVGYNKKKKVFIVRNSWGKDWGDGGYCYIPFSYMTNPEMIFDLVTIRKIDEKLNQEIRKNIWGDELGYFDDGANNQHKVELLTANLKDEEIAYKMLVNKYQVLEESFEKQESYFKDVANRNNIRQMLLDINLNNINQIEEKIIDNENKLSEIKNRLYELKAKEKQFLYKWIALPIVLFVLIFIACYFTNTLDNLSKFMISDFLSIFKGEGWKIINLFNSLIWCILFYWTIFCSYKYFKNFYLVFKEYNSEKKRIKTKDKNDKRDIVDLYNEKWVLRFNYLVNTELLEEILKTIRTFLNEKLKGVNSFIESVKQVRERISGSYKEAVIKDTEFSQNIFKIPDQNNIKEYYNSTNNGNSINLSVDNFHAVKTNSEYLDKFMKGAKVFEEEMKLYWSDKKGSYLKQYTLAELLNNNYFDINNKVDGWNEFLKTFSNPLLRVEDQDLSLPVEETIEVSFNDKSFTSFTKDLNRANNDVNITPHANDNEVTVFRFLNTFSASQIKCFRDFHHKDKIKDYFLYDDVPILKPNTN